jgi:hypothetical protein
MIINEVENYIKESSADDAVGVATIQEELNKFKTSIGDNKSIPVCILSHMFDEKRSKFITCLIKEEIDRPYIIFTYEDQKDLYEQFENISENLTVHYIPNVPEYNTLSGKRQYIIDYNKDKNDDAFFIEDDCFNFYLPIGGIGGTGNFRNKKFNMTFAFTFAFWEFLIKEHSLTYSGPVNNMEFTFRNVDENPFIKQNAQVVQSIHINIKSCIEKNINYDHNAGWDDYDMILQQCINNKGTQGIIFSYVTPSLKSGVSAMSSDADALAKRCEKNTISLISKWGLSLVREDTKKGLYNAKVNWNNIRKCYKNDIANILPEIIKLSNDEAKDFINEKLGKEVKKPKTKKINIPITTEDKYELWDW